MRYADANCNYTRIGDQIVFTGRCIITKKTVSVSVLAAELYAYRRDSTLKIQDALKSVSADDREFLMSGISKEGWDQTFGKDDREIITVHGPNRDVEQTIARKRVTEYAVNSPDGEEGDHAWTARQPTPLPVKLNGGTTGFMERMLEIEDKQPRNMEMYNRNSGHRYTRYSRTLY